MHPGVTGARTRKRAQTNVRVNYLFNTLGAGEKESYILILFGG